MKRYIKASTQKPVLDKLHTEWVELDDHSGIMFVVYSEDDEILFEELFNYEDVDSDAIYDSATDMAVAALSLKYDLTDAALEALESEVTDA